MSKGGTDIDTIDEARFVCPDCVRSFLRGVFVGCGSVNEPSKSTHLEMNVKSRALAEELTALMNGQGLTPKLIDRKNGRFGLYFKGSGEVEDFFGVIGANSAVFDYMNAKIEKDIRNNANRCVNCDTANIDKTIAASSHHMDAICRIIDSGRAGELSEQLKETLDLRVAYPGDSLLELAARHTPPLTKSGVNHRLAKLVEFSKNCKAGE